MADEPIPVDAIMADLDGQWNASNVVEPRFIEVTGSTSDPLRFDLNVKDVIVGRPGNPAFSEQPIGNWKYGNRLYAVELEISTNKVVLESMKLPITEENLKLLSEQLKKQKSESSKPRLLGEF